MVELWFSFRGRATRSDYWLRLFLPIMLISIVLGIVDGVLGMMNPASGMGLLSSLFSLFTIWPWLAVSVKRLHDRDQSGWFLLLWFIPIIGWIYLFVVIGFLRGTVGENRFGPDPLGSDGIGDDGPEAFEALEE